jgi:hypothetical protein
VLNTEVDELLDDGNNESEDEVDHEVDLAAQPLSCVGYGLGLSYDPMAHDDGLEDGADSGSMAASMAAPPPPRKKSNTLSKGPKTKSTKSAQQKADKLLAAWEKEAAMGLKRGKKAKYARRRDGDDEYDAV